jgi:energy-coupling factor transport system permease protein
VPSDPDPSTAGQVAAQLATVPDFVARQAAGPYRGLFPSTKLIIAFVQALIAIGVRGWTGPVAVAVVVLACAVYAGVTRRTIVVVALTFPLVLSILLVNTFGFPGAGDVVARIGPLTATWTGIAAAGQAVARVAAFALSVALFSLTTGIDELLADLERRGLGRRGSFVIGSALGMIPRIRERVAEVTDAQRARGLDTEGSWVKRLTGIVPLVGPVVFGSLTEVEERTMALEARGFSAPVWRTTLRTIADRPAERALRWVVAIGALAIVGLSIAGGLEGLP